MLTLYWNSRVLEALALDELAVGYRWLLPDGSASDMLGESYAFIITGPGIGTRLGLPVDFAIALSEREADRDGVYHAMRLPANTAPQLAGMVGLRWQVAEVLANGAYKPHVGGELKIGSVTGYNPPAETPVFTDGGLLIIEHDESEAATGNRKIRAIGTGRRGLASYEARFLAGRISEPTEEAEDAYLRGLATELSGTSIQGDGLVTTAGTLGGTPLVRVSAASEAEAVAGTSTNKAVTPKAMKAATDLQSAAILALTGAALDQRLRLDVHQANDDSSQAIGRENLKAAKDSAVAAALAGRPEVSAGVAAAIAAAIMAAHYGDDALVRAPKLAMYSPADLPSKNSYLQARDPLTSDDATLLYTAGSWWRNTATGAVWRCLSAANDAAVWVRVEDLPFMRLRDAYRNWGNGQDDTQAAADLLKTGQPLLLESRGPGKSVLFDNLELNSGDTVLGFGGLSYLGLDTRPFVKVKQNGSKEAFDAAFRLAPGAKGVLIQGIGINGYWSPTDNRNVNGIASGGDRVTARDVTMRYLNIGVGDRAGYSNTRKLWNCVGHECNSIMVNPIDSTVIDGEFAVCREHAFIFDFGAERNRMVNPRIEHGLKFAIAAIGASATQKVGNLSCIGLQVDRMGEGGLLFVNAQKIDVVGGNYTRNGHLASGMTGKSAHVVLDAATSDVIITATTAQHGFDDGGGGLDAPDFVIKLQGAALSNIVLVGNSWANGSINAQNILFKASGSSPGGMYIQKFNTGLVGEVSGAGLNESGGRTFQSSRSVVVQDGTTGTLSMTQQPVAANSAVPRTLIMTIIEPTAGLTYQATFRAVLRRFGGNATLGFSAAGQEIGTAGSIRIAAAATFRLDFPTIAADGSTFDLTIANAIGSTRAVTVSAEWS
ncbi:hypothetical protein [Sphingomonas dokdonensis]|uniref:Uncharacterized protein n=1 Tax=Sphingomonas dokdonensis TaxID=344880 RepID=A0A245ZHL4_9SPHN|nr:hypothetical protein [Sphingomonas dokdonensis]OWK29218.1 hypothetical protein SPDO_21990 [Sphingomonas dokdonensis]